jgi:glutathione S-transferase
MIEVHHLNESRSRRITWLLEELGLDYTVHVYKRDPKTRLAPPELEKIHPLGKAPVIRDGDEVVFESGAIIEYLVRKHGNGRLAPTQDTHAFNQYLQFLHYAEGSAMLPLMLKLYTGRLGEGAAPLQPRIESEMKRHLGFLDKSLEGHDYFVGNELTGADIQLSFAVQMAVKFCGDDAYPNLTAFVKRIEALPAYRRAIEKSGE